MNLLPNLPAPTPLESFLGRALQNQQPRCRDVAVDLEPGRLPPKPSLQLGLVGQFTRDMSSSPPCVMEEAALSTRRVFFFFLQEDGAPGISRTTHSLITHHGDASRELPRWYGRGWCHEAMPDQPSSNFADRVPGRPEQNLTPLPSNSSCGTSHCLSSPSERVHVSEDDTTTRSPMKNYRTAVLMPKGASNETFTGPDDRLHSIMFYHAWVAGRIRS